MRAFQDEFPNSMKKIAVAALCVGAVFFLSGCGKKENTPQNGAQKENVKNEEKGGMISSIKDAIGMGKKMECTYKMKFGEESMESKGFFEGKKFRSETSLNGKKQISVFNDDVMYSWSPDEKKGTKISKSCMKELSDKYKDESNPTKEEDLEIPDAENIEDSFGDAMDVNCNPVASIDFSVPGDVNFTDQCEIMRKSMEAMEELKNKMPSGMSNIPEIPGGLGQ